MQPSALSRRWQSSDDAAIAKGSGGLGQVRATPVRSKLGLRGRVAPQLAEAFGCQHAGAVPLDSAEGHARVLVDEGGDLAT
jgi:hypothetical protein